jgi:protein TonB
VLPAVPQVVQVALTGIRPGVAVDNSVRKVVDTPPPVPSKVPAKAREVAPPAQLRQVTSPVLTSAANKEGGAPALMAASVPTVSSSVASPATSSASSSERPVGATRDGVAVDTLSQYRLALGLEARRFKRYPRLARERGWEGRVELRIQVLSNGLVVPSVQRGSGFAVLDEQALEMLERAVRATPLPEGLRGRSLQIELPISFSLTEE